MALRSNYNYETQAEERKCILNFREKLAHRIRPASGNIKINDLVLNGV
jgi:hypothetical protein